MAHYKIVLVIPYEGLIEKPEQLFKEHSASHNIRDLTDDAVYSFSVHIANMNNIRELYVDADAIISRGLTCSLLRETRRYVDIPIVEISGSADLACCIHEAEKMHSSRRIGVIGSDNMIFGVEDISSIFDMEILPFRLCDQGECQKMVIRAAESGCDTIVAGLYTCACAEEIGLKSVLLKSGKVSFMRALSEAKKAAVKSRMQRLKRKYLFAVLDNAFSAILAWDNQGKILFFNAPAAQFLGLPSDFYPGSSITEIKELLPLKKILKSAEPFVDEVVTYKKRKLLLNKSPILIFEEQAGDILTIHSISEIENLDNRIRTKIKEKGLVARHTVEDIVGESAAVKKLMATAKKLSCFDSNVLIYGESGTGKELIAQSIHNLSDRRDGPFVAVNCAAIPESLMESEFFGYSEGAFTGAYKKGKPGHFEAAHRGTLFLDEAGELKPAMQACLLRVLQEREIMRIGENRTIPVDVRIIAASNRDLGEMARKKLFREDLFYRLNVHSLSIPPLRERPEDILPLVRFFFEELAERFQLTAPHLSTAGEDILLSHLWRGNIRELRNICERLITLYAGKKIGEEECCSVMDISRISPVGKNREEVLREETVKALRLCRYSKSKTASMLGISRSTLWRRLARLEASEEIEIDAS